MGVKDGSSCSGCGLANYEGLCPHCRGDQDAYERELVPPFASSLPTSVLVDQDGEEMLVHIDEYPLWKS